jgi:hypothetical protein
LHFPKFVQIPMNLGRFQNHLNISQNNSEINGKIVLASWAGIGPRPNCTTGRGPTVVW